MRLHQSQTLEELDLGSGYLHDATFLPLVFRQLTYACKTGDVPSGNSHPRMAVTQTPTTVWFR